MGTGRTSTQHPDRVPIVGAHTRITENVRRPAAGARLQGLDDVDQIVNPMDGHAYVYDSGTGSFKAVLPPPMLRFNLNGPVTVSSSDRDQMGGAGKLFKTRSRLKTAGSSDTVFDLVVGASTVVVTITIPSGSRHPSSDPDLSYAFDDDYFWVDVTTAGTGAEGLVVNVWAMAP